MGQLGSGLTCLESNIHINDMYHIDRLTAQQSQVISKKNVEMGKEKLFSTGLFHRIGTQLKV